MSSAPNRKMTVVEYLKAERASASRNIFFDGEMFAMTGVTREHSLIAGNTFTAINVQLQNRSCEAHINDLRVKNARTGSYFYPDVLATCESPKFEDDQFDTLVNPQVIIEVLSDSTENFDRGLKFRDYQLLESLKEYVLISQKEMYVERFTRKTESTWEFWSAKSPEDILDLAAIDCQISLARIFAKVEFKTDDRPDDDLKVIEEAAKYQSSGST